MSSPPNRRRYSAIVGALLFALFASLLAHTAWRKSPTWDEVGYFGLGAYLLKTGKWDVAAAASHPPLAYFVHSLPLLWRPLDAELWKPAAHVAGDLSYLRSADLERGNALLLDPAHNGEAWFFACRAMSLLFALPLFACLSSWAAGISGARHSLIALCLAAMSPNMLAHSALITTDFALTATFFCAVFSVRQVLLRPTRSRLLIAGIASGLALSTKLSALILLPAVLMAAVWFLLNRPAAGVSLAALFALEEKPGAGCGVAAAVWVTLAFFVVVIAHGFQIEPYFAVMRSQLWDLSSGHQAYLMGEISTRGWWYYFPFAFAIKTPLPLQILAGAGVAALVVSGSRRSRSERAELGLILIPPTLFAFAFVVAGGGKNIGLRYLLPVYPFLFLWAGGAFASASVNDRTRSFPAPRLGWRRPLLALLLIWMAVGTWRIHPHYLAHFNELVGGPAHGHRYLVDSNLDWGQDLKGLKEYVQSRGLQSIKLSYFGSVDPALYDLSYEWLPSFVLPARGRRHVELPTTGTIAISATNLVGLYMSGYGHGAELFSWLEEREPSARIGYSIFVYDIPE